MVESRGSVTDRKIAVIGLGSVGLPLALLFVSKGFQVSGIDLDHAKIEKLREGISYLTDIEDKEIRTALSTQRFIIADQYKEIAKVDIIIICVPTPLTAMNTPDLSFIKLAGNSLSSIIRKGQMVVLESSTYPGTTKEVLQPLLEQSRLRIGIDIFLGYSPERIDPGNKDFPIDKIPKVLAGVTAECTRRISQVYNQVFERMVIVSSPETAEFTKLLENSYRFINISFINQLAVVCDTLNVDVWEVIEAAKTKPYGYTPFYPGPGIGGQCIPVDPLYLQWKASQYGVPTPFIELSDKVNRGMSQYLVTQLKKHLSAEQQLDQAKLLVYGVSYKRDINDTRESSGLEMIRLLKKEGMDVSYHDPYIPSVQIGHENMHSVEITDEALEEAACVVILADHSCMPLDRILRHASLIFDTRNVTKGQMGKGKIIRLGGGNR
ncbi:nucleotide sugar dehydrogenase [Brevibacillus choshinensis]|uniref:nucleotide sugar dehydrogenase n=1 Tax=Brevibacillus choshinensis TaxID=54911 RepID=UPI002E2428A3|nr:nucleotide sugar dehydrogenase [Brevibacillus choshinensis]MED4585445.1 nucleotide sugar dehydrogenase [Brevibacillus choshinensis]MED4779075.1 nucleotide sugar dehydrogenase [Brevibacillus choshinensis]